MDFLRDSGGLLLDFVWISCEFHLNFLLIPCGFILGSCAILVVFLWSFFRISCGLLVDFLWIS